MDTIVLIYILAGFVALVGLGLVVLWLWALIDCAMNEPSEGSDKITWVLIILLANWIGAVIYLAARRPERRRLYGR